MCLLGAWNDTHIMLRVMKLTPAVSIARHLILSLAWDKSQAGITGGKGKETGCSLVGPSLIETILIPVKRSFWLYCQEIKQPLLPLTYVEICNCHWMESKCKMEPLPRGSQALGHLGDWISSIGEGCLEELESQCLIWEQRDRVLRENQDVLCFQSMRISFKTGLNGLVRKMCLELI